MYGMSVWSVHVMSTAVLLCVYPLTLSVFWFFFFFQAEDGIRDLVRSRGLGDVYKRQAAAFAGPVRAAGSRHRSGQCSHRAHGAPRPGL